MDETLTTKEVAEILKITRGGVIMLIRRKTIPATKRGRDLFIKRSDLDAYIEKRQKPGRPPTHRECTKCHTDKPMEEFGKNADGPWGYHSWCRICFTAYRKEKHETVYLERDRARSRAYYQNNKEYFKEHHAQMYTEKKEKLSAHYKEWRKTESGRAAIRRGNHSRRCRLLAVENNLTTEQITELMQRQKKCAYCKQRFTKQRYATLDHVIPLSKGGPHTISNIVLACKSCNSRKHDDVLHLF